MAANRTVSVIDKEGNWLFIAPVGNLVLTKEVENEYTLDRVLFIKGEKLRRIFKRFKLDPARIKSNMRLNQSIREDQTYALLHQSGMPSNFRRVCLQVVRNELDLLSASQLYYRRRRSMCRLGLFGEYKRGINETVLIDKKSDSTIVGSEVADSQKPLVLGKRWNNYHKGAFFGRFVKMLQDKLPVKTDWRTDLRRSILLVGKSINSYDIGSAFLWNMVALEMMLTRPGDSYSSVIPKRIEALLGWIGYWSTNKFKERIEEVYKLRCHVVHDGRLDLVTPGDLLFTEDLLVNVLENLLRHPKLFQSKDGLIKFADLVGAEHMLGQKSRIRPKTETIARLPGGLSEQIAIKGRSSW